MEPTTAQYVANSTFPRGAWLPWECRSISPLGSDAQAFHYPRPVSFQQDVGLFDQIEKNLDEHIAVYGPDNHLRLTGKHETAPWNKFSYGIADRGASVRVPHSFVKNDYKGGFKVGLKEGAKQEFSWCDDTQWYVPKAGQDVR